MPTRRSEHVRSLSCTKRSRWTHAYFAHRQLSKKPRNYRNIRQKVVEIDSQIYSTSNRNVCGLKIARFRAVFRCWKCDPVFSQCCHRASVIFVKLIKLNIILFGGFRVLVFVHVLRYRVVYHVYAVDIFVIFNLRSCVRDFSQLCDRFVLRNIISYFGFWVL